MFKNESCEEIIVEGLDSSIHQIFYLKFSWEKYSSITNWKFLTKFSFPCNRIQICQFQIKISDNNLRALQTCNDTQSNIIYSEKILTNLKMACLNSCWRTLVQIPSITWPIYSTDAWKSAKFPTYGKRGKLFPYSNQVTSWQRLKLLTSFIVCCHQQSRSSRLSCYLQWLGLSSLLTISTAFGKEDLHAQPCKGF